MINHPPKKTVAVGKTYVHWFQVSIIIGLCLLVLIGYGSGLDNKPVAEDFLRPEAFLELGDDRNFRPVFAILMLALQAIAGPHPDNPQVYHLFSILIHMVATIGLFLFARRLTASQNIALVIAFIFALYPRHHEPVFWPASSLHSVMVACLLFSLGCYLKWRQRGSRYWLIISVVLFGMSIFSNEAGAVGIVAFLTYEILWRNEELGLNWHQKASTLGQRLLPFIIVIGLYGVVLIAGSSTLSRFVGDPDDTSFYHLSFGLGQIRDYGGYVSYTLVPFIPLRLDSVWLKLGTLAFTFVTLVVCLIWGSRLVRFGVIWIVTMVLPYVLLVPFGNADRYFYLPSVGFCITVVGLFSTLGQAATKRSGTIGLRLAVISGIVLMIAYTGVVLTSIQARSREWQEAGEMVESLLNQVYTLHPTVESGTILYFLNLPKQYGQAKAMGFGMRAALLSYYDQPGLTVNTGSYPELLLAIEAVYEQSAHPQADEPVYIYVYEDGKLLDRSSTLGDPHIRSLLEAYAYMP